MEYTEIKECFNKNDKIVSLKDGNVYVYSGFLSLLGMGVNSKGYDSFNNNLLLYDNQILATISRKGIDHEHIKAMNHINNVRNTCRRLGCTPSELLKKDYISELNHNQ